MRDEFIENFKKNIEEKYGESPNVTQIVDYAFESAVVTPQTIRDYNIRSDYDSIRSSTDQSDHKIMLELGDKYGTCRENIYRIIKE